MNFNKCYKLIKIICAVLLIYYLNGYLHDLKDYSWIDIANPMFTLHGFLQYIGLPFFCVFLILLWATYQRSIHALSIMMLISIFLVLNGVDNISYIFLLFSIPHISLISIQIKLSFIIFGIIEWTLSILIWLIFYYEIIRTKKIPNLKSLTLNKLDADHIYFWILAIIGIAVFVIQLIMFLIAYNKAFGFFDAMHYMPSLSFALIIIWAGLKFWRPIITLLLTLSPLLIIIGAIGIGINKTTILVKIQGGLYLILTGLAFVPYIIK